MKPIFTTEDSVTVEFARNLLQEEGIECRLLHQLTPGAFVSSAFAAEVFELWIIDDQDESRATEIIERLQSGAMRETTERNPWKCPKCEQMIEGQFTECWHCLLEEDYDPRKDPKARCAECGYSLWRLPDRRCPECGEDF